LQCRVDPGLAGHATDFGELFFAQFLAARGRVDRGGGVTGNAFKSGRVGIWFGATETGHIEQ
jgi:hypothetical protein